MIHLEMSDPEARRLLRLLESNGRADRFPITVKQLRRFVAPLTPSGLAPADSAVDGAGRKEDRLSQTEPP
jgi:hypothetical protein